MDIVFCYNCGTKLNLSQHSKISRSETCERCDADVRVCKNCTHFDPKAYNECKESQAERVLDKERGNYCDYFQLRAAKEGSGDASADNSGEPEEDPITAKLKRLLGEG